MHDVENEKSLDKPDKSYNKNGSKGTSGLKKFEVVSDGVHVRAYEDIGAPSVTVLKRGETFEVDSSNVGLNWIRVDEGFIRNREFIVKEKE